MDDDIFKQLFQNNSSNFDKIFGSNFHNFKRLAQTIKLFIYNGIHVYEKRVLYYISLLFKNLGTLFGEF